MMYRIVKSKPHSLWIDNFSKITKWQIPSAEKDLFVSMLWTGYALRAYPFEIDMTFKKDPLFNEVIPAMPLSPLVYVNKVLQNIKRFVYNRPNPSRRYGTSLSVQWSVNNVPVAPDKNNDRIPSRFKEAIGANRDNLRNLYPEKITSENIGSNDGLGRIMKELQEERNWRKTGNDENACKEYSVITADCNIFDRIVKVRQIYT